MLLAFGGIGLMRFGTRRSVAFLPWVESVIPGLIPSDELRPNLTSHDNDLKCETLGILTDREDPCALDLAIPLLENGDDYVWLNAAHYVGSCGRIEAVPYLIKALRHSAWRGDADVVGYLRSITGKDFGTDFNRWHEWWISEHPDFQFDWESKLGPIPRLPLN